MSKPEHPAQTYPTKDAFFKKGIGLYAAKAPNPHDMIKMKILYHQCPVCFEDIQIPMLEASVVVVLLRYIWHLSCATHRPTLMRRKFLIYIKDCMHIFCFICLLHWLYEHNTCPVCRNILWLAHFGHSHFASVHQMLEVLDIGEPAARRTIQELGLEAAEPSAIPLQILNTSVDEILDRHESRLKTERMAVGFADDDGEGIYEEHRRHIMTGTDTAKTDHSWTGEQRSNRLSMSSKPTRLSPFDTDPDPEFVEQCVPLIMAIGNKLDTLEKTAAPDTESAAVEALPSNKRGAMDKELEYLEQGVNNTRMDFGGPADSIAPPYV
jgi:hypothetical protein